jgi:Replication initiator protein A
MPPPRPQQPAQQSLIPADEPQRREIVRVEKNLNTFGFFTPSSKRPRVASKSVSLQVRSADGRRMEAKATIFAAAELGLPTTADQDKYFAFQKIIERIRKREGVITNPVRFSSAALIGILGKTDGGKNYREIWEWLRRMTLTGIESEGVIYLAGRKKYARDLFHVFQRSVAVGEVMEDGRIAEDNYVWLSEWQLENLNNRHTLPIDYDVYKTLQLHIAKALVPLLQIWFYASRNDQQVEKKYSQLCSLLGLQQFKSPSRIKQQVGPSLDELRNKRFLSTWELTRTIDQTDYKLVLQPGPTFVSSADLRAGAEPRALSSPRHAEILEALLGRGVREDRARKLLLDLPDDQAVLDQIEWGDAEISRKERTNDPIANPPGFYVYLLRANYPVPANFDTSHKRQLREEARQKQVESVSRAAQKELERYEQREQYESFITEQTDAHIRQAIPSTDVERFVRAHMKKIKDEYPFYRWPEQALREFAWRKFRQELSAELNLPDFDEFIHQRSQRLF